MASSRQMRGRRVPSPGISTNIPTQARNVIKKESQPDSTNGSTLDEWDEPPLRAPAPSFEDHKGLERHGVLEHMAPLGHLPGQKLKAKMRYQETGSRRTTQLKNGEVKSVSEEVNIPELPPPALSRRPEPRKQDILPPPSSSREREEDRDYEPQSTTRATPAKIPVPIQPATNGTPISRTAEQRAKFDEVVRKAIRRAAETGDKGLGLALQQLHEESFQNERVAKLLHDVLAQKQTEEQIIEFQRYIKIAKKAIKRGGIKPAPITNTLSQSPNKNGRTGVTRQPRNLNNDTLPPEPNRDLSPATSSKRQLSNTTAGASPSKDEPPSKRIKRVDSASSDSSALSDLGSAVEDFAPEAASSSLAPTSNNRLPPQRTFSTGLKPAPTASRSGPSSRSRQSDPTHSTMDTYTQHPIETAADAAYAAKRRKLASAQNFDDYSVTESSMRPISRDLRPPQTPPAHISIQRTPQQPQSRLRNGTVQRNKRYDDDDDTLSSPPSSPGDLLIPPPAGASRGGTPARQLKPGKKGPKGIKNSPLKKRNGVTAGVAPPTDAGTASFGYRRSDDNHNHENSDLCAACSGSGQLLCCDGCDRAFHFTCLQPPMNPETPPEGEWFCYRCLKARLEHPLLPPGIFRDLDTDVNVKNPSAFNLPPNVRNYFDGVKTGEEGEYEESNSVRAKKTHGYEENPNNLKLRDNKDNTVLCFRCGKSAMGTSIMSPMREIASCDFCISSWHLDCLDPPLASAPNKKSTNGKSRHPWMCPNHIDDELAHMDASLKRSPSTANFVNQPTSRTYRVRRPKHAKILEIGLRRGFRNNGLIEIENELSEEESEIEREMSGVIYRVPEKGLKLDFIDHINRLNGEAGVAKQKANRHNIATQTATPQPTVSSPLPAPSPIPIPSPTNGRLDIDELPFAQRKAALNLVQFAQTDSALDTNTVKNLIQTLTAEAPSDVEALVAAAEEPQSTNAETKEAFGKSEKAASAEVKNDVCTEDKNDTVVEDKDGAPIVDHDKKIAGNAATATTAPSLSTQEKNDLQALISLATRRLNGSA